MAFNRRDTIILRCLSVAAFIFFAYMVLRPMARWSVPTWPPVDDPNLLLVECTALMGHPGSIQEPNWPATIRSLKPRFVTVLDDCVEITISTGGINPAWGYLAYPDGRSSTTPPSGDLIRARVSDGLFTYENDE